MKLSLAELEDQIRFILPQIIQFRHDLHRIPELAGKEFKTSAMIREKLAPLGLEILPPVVGTDVIAFLNREKHGNLTLRADIDALPVEEDDKTCPYRSTHPGFMHACGHDGHTATLYGAALVLSGLKEEIPVSLRFLFQPGEEALHMAADVLAAGGLSKPEPDFILGLHNWPNEPFGAINTKPGILMAAAVHFKIILHGKSGHGSLPHLANNPIDCAADILCETRAIIPQDCVLSFCQCVSGTSGNNIPDTALLQGTLRFLDLKKGEKFLEDFKRTVLTICDRRGIRCELDAPLGYLPLVNRPEDYEKVRALLADTLPEGAYTELPAHVMSSEDFSWYLQKYHGLFAHLGSANTTAPLHSSKYDFNDELLFAGIRYFCLTALQANKLIDIS